MATANHYEYNGKVYLEVKVKVRDKTGKQVTRKSRFTKSGKRISSKKTADIVKNQLRDQLLKDISGLTNHTWSSWNEEFLRRIKIQYKESTTQLYDGFIKRWIDPYWNDKKIESLSREDVHALVFDYLELRGASPWTQRNCLKKVHRIFEMALEDGIIHRNPASGFRIHEPESNSTALSAQEVGILFSKAREYDHPFFPIWVTAAYTGMRNGELYSLRWSDLDLDRSFIDLRTQFTKKDGVHLPKKGRIRKVDLHPSLKKFLLEWRNRHGEYSEELWEWENKRLSQKRLLEWNNLVLPRVSEWKWGMQARELRSFCKKIGITSVKMHDLRATHITNLLDNGTPITKVMKQVGHSKMQTTDRYNRLSAVQIKGVSKNLNFGIPEEKAENVISLFSDA